MPPGEWDGRIFAVANDGQHTVPIWWSDILDVPVCPTAGTVDLSGTAHNSMQDLAYIAARQGFIPVHVVARRETTLLHVDSQCRRYRCHMQLRYG